MLFISFNTNTNYEVAASLRQ